MSVSSFFQSPSRIIMGAAVLAAAFTGAAFWWQDRDGADNAELVAALNAFTGEWKGEATIEAADGTSLARIPVTRRYAWVGDRQVVETRFHAGAEGYATRAIQWIEGGRLHAVVTGPEDQPHAFSGARTSDGILWTNLDHPDSDCLERLVVRSGETVMQSASFTKVRLGTISGLVGVAAIFERQVTSDDSLHAENLKKVTTRVDELERTLASVVQEREELRSMLERAEQARLAFVASAAAPATNSADTGSGARLVVNSAPAGLAFQLHAVGTDGAASERPVFTGITPLTLQSLPAGDYAVTVRSEGLPDVVHHVVLRAERDVVLFHRNSVAQPAREPSGTPEHPETAPAPQPSVAPAAESEDYVARINELDRPPEPVRTVMPRLERHHTFSGQQVKVSVLVDEKGVPHDAAVVEGTDRELVALCQSAVAKWRFTPATVDGRPVKVRVTVPFAVR